MQCEEGTRPAEDPEVVETRLFGVRKLSIVPLVIGRKGGGRPSTSSVTLVKTLGSTVVVDSGSPEVGNEILEGMKAADAKMEKVNVLVTTRADSLHTGNDHLFVHALQHVRKGEWSDVPFRSGRKVAITNRVHWIDRYLMLVSLPFPEPGSLALLVHLPRAPNLIDPVSKHLAGKIIGVAGFGIPSCEDPEVKKALKRARSMDRSKVSPSSISTIEDLLAYCDQIVPAYGPMFPTRPEHGPGPCSDR